MGEDSSFKDDPIVYFCEVCQFDAGRAESHGALGRNTKTPAHPQTERVFNRSCNAPITKGRQMNSVISPRWDALAESGWAHVPHQVHKKTAFFHRQLAHRFV